MGIDLNFGDVAKESKFSILPEGIYDAVIADTSLDPSKDKTSTNLVINYEITSPEFEGRKLKSWKSLKPNALWSLAADLEAIYDKPMHENLTDWDHRELRGFTCRLVLTEGEYNGKATNNIQKVLPSESDSSAQRRRSL